MNSGAASRGLALAAELLEAGQPAKALPLLHAHLASHPDHAEAHTRLAQAYLGLDDFILAREAAERASSLDPDGEHAYRLLALAWAHLGYRNEAVRASETALHLAPESWHVHNVRASIDLLAASSTPAGAAALQRQLELEPDLAASHTTAASFLLGTRTVLTQADRVAVRQHLETALSIEPENSFAMYALSNLESRSPGRTTQSIVPVLEMAATHPTWWANRRAILAAALSNVRLLAWVYTVLLIVVFNAVTEPELFDYVVTAVVTAAVAIVCTLAYLIWVIITLRGRALTMVKLATRLSRLFTLRLIVMALGLGVLLTGPLVSVDIAEWTTFFAPALLLVTGIIAYADHLRGQPTRG